MSPISPYQEIIIIEDDKVLALLQKRLIEKAFQEQTRLFLKAPECLDFLSKLTVPDHRVLIFLDLNLPEMSGWTFLKELKKKELSSNVDIVIVTSSVFQEDFERSKEFRNVVGYLTKPLREEHLEKIQETLGSYP